MFCHRRHLHRWACRVLMAWLFSVAAGVANACVVANLANTDGQQRSAAAVAAGAKTVSIGTLDHSSHQAQPERGQGHGASSAKANCQDFCDKSAVTVPKVKTAVDGVGGYGLPPAALRVALPIPELPPVQHGTLGLEGGHAPPITIAFLRLTL